MATAAAAAAPCRSCSHTTPATRRPCSPLMVLASRIPKAQPFRSSSLGLDSPWSGLKLVGVVPPPQYREKKERCRGKVVYASLFGVGTPEVLVIGVVALLVFGPKGLAEVARNLGKTLRTFQPTIRELQEVSREFKSTLEQEIGLNEVTSSVNNISKSNSFANENQQAVIDTNGTPAKPYTSDEFLEVTEEQLSASADISQTEASSSEEPKVAPTTTATTKTTQAATTTPEVTTSDPAPEATARMPSENSDNERQ